MNLMEIMDNFISAKEARFIQEYRQQSLSTTIKDISEYIRKRANEGCVVVNIDLPLDSDKETFDLIEGLLKDKGYKIEEKNTPFKVLSQYFTEHKRPHNFVISWYETKEDNQNE